MIFDGIKYNQTDISQFSRPGNQSLFALFHDISCLFTGIEVKNQMTYISFDEAELIFLGCLKISWTEPWECVEYPPGYLTLFWLGAKLLHGKLLFR